MNANMSAKNIMIELAEKFRFFRMTHLNIDGSWPGKTPKPGAYLQSLPEDIQEKLKELKSDDLKNLRIK